MNIHKEESKVENVFIFGATSEDELLIKIEELMSEGFDLITQNSLNYGTHVEYNAKLQRYID